MNSVLQRPWGSGDCETFPRWNETAQASDGPGMQNLQNKPTKIDSLVDPHVQIRQTNPPSREKPGIAGRENQRNEPTEVAAACDRES